MISPANLLYYLRQQRAVIKLKDYPINKFPGICDNCGMPSQRTSGSCDVYFYLKFHDERIDKPCPLRDEAFDRNLKRCAQCNTQLQGSHEKCPGSIGRR